MSSIIIISSEKKEEFTRTEAVIRKRIEANKRISPKLAKAYLDALYFKPEVVERDPIVDDFASLMLMVVKAKTIAYLKDSAYWFSKRRKGVKYSLRNWIEIYFSEIQTGNIDVKDREVFIINIAKHLNAYLSDLKQPISYFGVCVVTGYIAHHFGHMSDEKTYKLKPSTYPSYNSYLYKQVGQIWKKKG